MGAPLLGQQFLWIAMVFVLGVRVLDVEVVVAFLDFLGTDFPGAFVGFAALAVGPDAQR